MEQNFKPTFLLKNKHIQTIYSSIFRKLPDIEFEIYELKLDDLDRLDLYFYMTDKKDAPFVILFHGLAGSYKSPYIKGMVEELHKNGFNCVVSHFRGCADKENLLPRSYHSGETQDAKYVIEYVKRKYNPIKIFGIGYSLGANMLLKLLGEMGENVPLDGAVAVSAPMKLDVCANSINRGFSRFYQKRLLKDLNDALDKKYDMFDMKKLLNFKREDIKNIKTFWEFDEIYTAPIHNFLSAKDYYEKSSSFQFLKDIKKPTLIIHAKDDPFMDETVIPTKDDVSQYVKLEIYEYGGHVGFIEGSIFKPIYWLEKHSLNFFKSQL